MPIVGEIRGLAGLTDALKALPSAVAQEDALGAALVKGGEIIRDQAEANLVANGSVDTGLLSRTVEVKKVKSKVDGRVNVVVKPSTKLSMVVRKGKTKATRARPSKYAHFIEYGTEHSQAAPFLRPAVDTKGDEAVRAIGKAVQNGVDAAARRAGLK